MGRDMPKRQTRREVRESRDGRILRVFLLVCLLCSLILPAPAVSAPPGFGPGGRGVSGTSAEAPIPQHVSSFYLQLFESGQKAFHEKRYRDAAKDLEIAVFGLANDRILFGKAQLYLAICFNYLAMRSKIEPALMQAARLLGPEEVKIFGLDENVLALLRKLAEDFRVDLNIPPPPGSDPADGEPAAPPAEDPDPPESQAPPLPDLVVVKKIETPPPSPDPPPNPEKTEKNGDAGLKSLLTRLKSEPGNGALVEEVVSLYLQERKPKRARTILEKYLEIQPRDLSAIFALARTNYFLKDYRVSMDGLQAVSSPAAEAALGRVTNLKVVIYKSLCLHALGQDSSVPAYLNFINASFGPGDIARILEEEGLAGAWETMVQSLKR